jgi:DNA polymerase/3'-5' exonuclease PolX
MKEDVGDVDIVCIPKYDINGRGERLYQWGAVKEALHEWRMIKGGERMQQYEAEPCEVDVYITTVEQWGVIFTQRTGCADFSKKLVSSQSAGGLMPAGMRIKEGRVWKDGAVLETPEERDVFAALGAAWVEPVDRG